MFVRAMVLTSAVLVAWMLTSPLVDSAQWTAKVLLSKQSKQKVPGLTIKTKRVRVRGSKAGLAPAVKIKGKIAKRDWGIFYKGKWLVKPNARNRSFSIKTRLRGEKTFIKMKAIGPSQQEATVKILVKFPAWKALQTGLLIDEEPYQEKTDERRDERQDERARERRQERENQEREQREREQERADEKEEARRQDEEDREERRRESRRSRRKSSRGSSEQSVLVMASLGGSSIAYTEAGVDDYSMTALTGKLMVRYSLVPKKWDLAANIFGTLLPLSSSAANTSVRYFGFNARLGYRLIDSAPWSFSVLLGAYYTTMSVSNNAFGFKNMLGPSLTGVLKNEFSGGDSLFFYGKVAIVAGLDFANREIAFGGGYVYVLENGHPLSFNLDYSGLEMTILGTAITSTSTSFSIGYGF